MSRAAGTQEAAFIHQQHSSLSCLCVTSNVLSNGLNYHSLHQQRKDCIGSRRYGETNMHHYLVACVLVLIDMWRGGEQVLPKGGGDGCGWWLCEERP